MIIKNTFNNDVNSVRPYGNRVSLPFIEDKFLKLNICVFVKESNVEDFGSFMCLYSLQKNSHHWSLCIWI